MNKEYLTIHHSILPDYYDKVLQANKLIEEEHKSVSSVCKDLDISRSTYYKYKDKIFYATCPTGSKYTLLIKAHNNHISLLSIINEIVSFKAMVYTINQSAPLEDLIVVMVTIVVGDNFDELYKNLVSKFYEVSLIGKE